MDAILNQGDIISCLTVYSKNPTKYCIDKRIASGGQGEVYSVYECANSNNTYLFKIILVENKECKKRIIDNILYLKDNYSLLMANMENYMKKTNKFAIAFPFGFYNDGKNFGYLMNRLHGTTLDKLMSKQINFFDNKTLEEKLNFIKGICEIANFLQKSGFCYQDFNPKNFLYDDKTEVISLIDLDNTASTSLSKNGIKNTVKGYGFYVAPEIVIQTGIMPINPSVESDNYSLAYLFYRILGIDNKHPYFGQKIKSDGLIGLGDMNEIAEAIEESGKKDIIVEHFIFIFDDVDKSNSGENLTSPNQMKKWNEKLDRWNKLPKELQNLFIRAFKTPFNPVSRQNRPKPEEWIQALDEILYPKKTSAFEQVSRGFVAWKPKVGLHLRLFDNSEIKPYGHTDTIYVYNNEKLAPNKKALIGVICFDVFHSECQEKLICRYYENGKSKQIVLAYKNQVQLQKGMTIFIDGKYNEGSLYVIDVKR